MAKFKVEIKSRDMIKPFSETPKHLKTLKLSFIDQISPPVHMPYTLYYQTPSGHNNNFQTTKLLKDSLSETLVQFYPLAGRVVGNSSIDCNDEGVEFYEADVLASLSEVIANPDPEELIRLLPYGYAPLSSIKKTIVTVVQVNHFSCGGMAISICISHKISDAGSSTMFINAWARNARGISNNNHHHSKLLVTFDTSSLLSPLDLNGVYDDEDGVYKEKIVTRRLILDKETIDALKKKCDDGRLGRPSTRTEVVSAFIWKKFIKIARAKKFIKTFYATQVVNLKKIKGSPIPANCHSNLFWPVFASTPVESETEYSEAVDKLRTVVKQIDTSYLEKMKTGECLLEPQQTFESLNQEDTDYCALTSCITFPIYEVNFGWGNPIWISPTTLPFKNTVFLLPTKCGQGIEVWMNVPEQDVVTLDQDHEIRSLTSQNIRAKL